MNGSRPVRYRRYKYRAKKIKLAVIISAAALVFAVLMFLIIGNILNDKVSEDGGRRTTASTTAERPKTAQIKAYSINPDGDITGEISAAAGFGADSISFPVKDSAGGVTYSSELLKKMGEQINSSKPALSAVFAAAKGKYVSAYLEITALSETNAALRSVLLARDAALACEVTDGGARDVLIRAQGMGADNYTEIIRLAAQIKSVNPNVVIGLATDVALAADENSAVILDALWEAFDFLAADLTGGEDTAAVSAAAEGMHFEMLRYEMRALIPRADGNEGLHAIIAALEERGIGNWQIVG